MSGVFAISVPTGASGPTHVLSVDPSSATFTSVFAFPDTLPGQPLGGLTTTTDSAGTIYFSCLNYDTEWLGIAWYNPKTHVANWVNTSAYIYGMGFFKNQLFGVVQTLDANAWVAAIDLTTGNFKTVTPAFEQQGWGTAAVLDPNLGVFYSEWIDSNDEWWTVMANLNTGDVTSVPLGIYQENLLLYDTVQRNVVGYFFLEREHNSVVNGSYLPGTVSSDGNATITTNGAGFPIDDWGVQTGTGVYNPQTQTIINIMLDKKGCATLCPRLVSTNPYTRRVETLPVMTPALQTWSQDAMVFAYVA
jgi:hypothetical protein